MKNEYEKGLAVTFREQDGCAAGNAPRHNTWIRYVNKAQIGHVTNYDVGLSIMLEALSRLCDNMLCGLPAGEQVAASGIN